MVHPLLITAAATASVGAAITFELTIFKPWREENWPQGIRQGIRTELFKIRKEIEESVNEIRDKFSDPRRRLSDGELDEFRRGMGDYHEATGRREFEMHERETSRYRDRMGQEVGRTSGLEIQQTSVRRRGTARGGEFNSSSPSTPPPAAVPSPELPHHAVGEASPSMTDTASLVDGELPSPVMDGTPPPLPPKSEALRLSLDPFRDPPISSWQTCFGTHSSSNIWTTVDEPSVVSHQTTGSLVDVSDDFHSVVEYTPTSPTASSITFENVSVERWTPLGSPRTVHESNDDSWAELDRASDSE